MKEDEVLGSRPVVGMLLLGEQLSVEQVADALTAAGLEPTTSAGDAGEPVVELTLGADTVFVSVLDRSLAGDGVLNDIHPLLTEEEDFPVIGAHAAHIVVVATNFADDSREARRALHSSHARVVEALAQLEEAVGYAIDGTTMGVEAVRRILSEGDGLPVSLWAPAWVWTGDDGVTAYTYGLAQFGHPELQLVDVEADAAEVYVLLQDAASAVIGGEELIDGRRLSSRTGAEFQVRNAQWVVDTSQPARQLEF